MQEQLRSLLDRRTKRAIGVILGVAERELNGLKPAQWEKLRAVVRETLFDFRDMVSDVMESLDTGEYELNALWLAKIDSLHDEVSEIRDLLKTG